MTDATRSEALRNYVGWGHSPSPHADPERVHSSLPEHRAKLVAYVQAVVADMWATYPLFGQGNLALLDAMSHVETGMASRHPELDAEAARALAWMWGYSAWK